MQKVSKQNQPIDLEVNFDETYNQVEIIANERVLNYLGEILHSLAHQGKSGSHYEFDFTNGMRGNVSLLVVSKR